MPLPETFGKYELLQKIACGGMAEVFRARAFGIEGFQKPIAIKRILPHISSQPDFVTMLADEARTVVRLTHANIVEVYDFGKVEDIYYLAMEFVDGLDLATLLNRCREKKIKIPSEIAAWIVRDVCRGLAYAHGRTDEEGKPLGIVHRDISPANIMAARSGEVKLTDFGIAKAASNVHHTQQGILKGKIIYMAPEYALGNEPTPQSDLFSLGLVLYELLTCERFFDGESQTDVFRKVRETRITEREIPESIPPALKKILARSLAYDPVERYRSAEEFEEALTIYLSAAAPDFIISRLAQFLKPFLPEEASLSRPFEAVAKLVPSALRPMATEMMKRSAEVKRPLGGLLIFSGVIGDLLKPVLASFSSVLCLGSLAGAVVSAAVIRKKMKGGSLGRIFDSKTGTVFVFLAASFLMWGVIAFVQVFTPQRGVLGASIPSVASVQDLLAGIAGKVAKIETTTEKISQDVQDIKRSIESMGNRETLIDRPKAPEEFYHNARVYQLRGMNEQALEAFKKFLEKAPDYVDVHLAVQMLQRNTPGAADLTGWYGSLAERFPRSGIVAMARVLLQGDRSTRIAALEDLKKKYPDLAPVSLLLSHDYYDQGWVAQTEAYQQNLRILFGTVRKEIDRGALQAYFIDKEALERELEPLRAFDRYANAMGASWNAAAMEITYEETSSGLSISLIPKQGSGIKKIYYSIDDPEPKIDTGTSPYLTDPLTKQSMPNFQVFGTVSPGPHTIYGRYLDKDDKLSAVVSRKVENRPFRVLTSSLPGELGAATVNVEVTFDPKEGHAYRYLYSLDRPNPDQKADEAKLLLKGLARGTHTLYVRGVESGSGKETEVFEFPVEAN